MNFENKGKWLSQIAESAELDSPENEEMALDMSEDEDIETQDEIEKEDEKDIEEISEEEEDTDDLIEDDLDLVEDEEIIDESVQKNENDIQYYKNFVDIADKLEKKLGKQASDEQLKQIYKKTYPNDAGRAEALLRMYHRSTNESAQKNEAMPPIGQRKRIEFEDDIVKVYDGNKEIYAGAEDYEPMQDEDWKWDNTNKYYKFDKYIKVCCESAQKNESLDEKAIKDYLNKEHSRALKNVKNMSADDSDSFYKGYATAIHELQRKFNL